MIRRIYEIRIEGDLGDQWGDWFGGVTTFQESGGQGAGITTVLCGCLDQARLHGILMKIRDLGLSLVSVQEVRRKDETNGSV